MGNARRVTIAVFLAVFSATIFSTAAHANDNYMWCLSVDGRSGGKVYYSDPFSAPISDNLKAETAFEKYVRSNYQVGTDVRSACENSKGMPEATSSRDRDATMKTSGRGDVVFTHWTY